MKHIQSYKLFDEKVNLLLSEEDFEILNQKVIEFNDEFDDMNCVLTYFERIQFITISVTKRKTENEARFSFRPSSNMINHLKSIIDFLKYINVSLNEIICDYSDGSRIPKFDEVNVPFTMRSTSVKIYDISKIRLDIPLIDIRIYWDIRYGGPNRT